MWGRVYPEVTPTFLPSSLTRFHSFTLAHLCQPTCVGLRYGSYILSPTGFSRRLIHSKWKTEVFLKKSNNLLNFKAASPFGKIQESRNINRLSIT
jgi:hypothetical protein